jgi:hypothetical protein
MVSTKSVDDAIFGITDGLRRCEGLDGDVSTQGKKRTDDSLLKMFGSVHEARTDIITYPEHVGLRRGGVVARPFPVNLDGKCVRIATWNVGAASD